MWHGQCNFKVLSKEVCFVTKENLEPNLAGLKSSGTREDWCKSLKENHSALIKERSLLGHIMRSEEAQKKILESDIFRILESDGVTQIGALYKISPSKFILVFRSKTANHKLGGREIQCRFGDSETCLNFWKGVGPLRNGETCFLQFWRST